MSIFKWYTDDVALVKSAENSTLLTIDLWAGEFFMETAQSYKVLSQGVW